MKGGFSLPAWGWSTKFIKPRSAHPGLHQRFGEILDENGLTEIVQEPTRKQNVLDLIFTDWPSQIMPGISDHEAVYTELDLKPMRKKQLPRQVHFTLRLTGLAFANTLRNSVTKFAKLRQPLTLRP
ncbi:hypothetical protein HOLleu_06813 [Holothuria leucospilota]|uniref:Uncharacterized protein n=1 Tax=Holothuria leucospilota TaxID=206669 RepID=A0A9Q1CMN9_HOLLE|nr:hypothetical protein HOLleu_06813 [Holothuria leucospilota]